MLHTTLERTTQQLPVIAGEQRVLLALAVPDFEVLTGRELRFRQTACIYHSIKRDIKLERMAPLLIADAESVQDAAASLQHHVTSERDFEPLAVWDFRENVIVQQIALTVLENI